MIELRRAAIPRGLDLFLDAGTHFRNLSRPIRARRWQGIILCNDDDLSAGWRHGRTREARAKNGKSIGRKRQSEGDGERRSFHKYHT